MTRMLQVEGLTKRFGAITAVDDITFSVDRGEVLGFLGPNGAGKSTTMKMVTGYLPATAGTAIVCGFDVAQNPIEVKKRIGYLPEGAPLYEDMTPLGFLSFVAELRGMRGAEKEKAIDRAADMIHIKDVLYQPIGTLSKGYKRRVGLAQAVLHDPEVMILDEPTDGLDPNQKHDVRQLIDRMAEDKVIVISTHILEEVEAVCSRAIIIARGKIVADGTPLDLMARSDYHNAVSIRCRSQHEGTAKQLLTKAAGVQRVETIEEVDGAVRVIAFPEGGKMIIETVNAELKSSSFPAEEISVERGRLDDVFRQITTG